MTRPCDRCLYSVQVYPAVIAHSDWIHAVYVDAVCIITADGTGRMTSVKRRKLNEATRPKECDTSWPDRDMEDEGKGKEKGEDTAAEPEAPARPNGYRPMQVHAQSFDIQHGRILQVVRFFKYIICAHERGRVLVWDSQTEVPAEPSPVAEYECDGTVRKLKVDRHTGCIIILLEKEKGCIEMILWSPVLFVDAEPAVTWQKMLQRWTLMCLSCTCAGRMDNPRLWYFHDEERGTYGGMDSWETRNTTTAAEQTVVAAEVT